MRVISKQRNSRMCIMCGLDNEYGVMAPFYNMEHGSVATGSLYLTVAGWRAGAESSEIQGGISLPKPVSWTWPEMFSPAER